MKQNDRKALIVGATGLVGNELLQQLLQSEAYDNITILVRTPLSIEHPKLIQIPINFDELDSFEERFAVHDVFCCLGTTIKKAGSQEAFKKVDYEYPLHAAMLSKKQAASQFFVVSAVGANSKSRIFYSRTKGELEDALQRLQFQSLHIFRPSLLLGDRKEFRFGEKLASMIIPALSPLFVGRFKKYKPVQASVLAQTMLRIASSHRTGSHVYEWGEEEFS